MGTGEGNGGVYGGTKDGVAVHGYSFDNYGVVGEAGNIGVFGRNLRSGFNAYLGTQGLAGDFYGDVWIHGGLTVVGHKSAAVTHPDGSHRQLYCLESTELWFEDFGKAQLIAGAGEVHLDPDFAALVDTTDYHVFLTEYGDSAGLFVAEQQPTRFVVRERGGGTSNLRFGYRIVAKRADVVRPRLARIDPPSQVEPPPSHPLTGPKAS
jgi:hypothetical protein